MTLKIVPWLLLLALAFPPSVAISAPSGPDETWADEVPYTTSWKDAIAECKATGKLLFIYNGWKREKV